MVGLIDRSTPTLLKCKCVQPFPLIKTHIHTHTRPRAPSGSLHPHRPLPCAIPCTRPWHAPARRHGATRKRTGGNGAAAVVVKGRGTGRGCGRCSATTRKDRSSRLTPRCVDVIIISISARAPFHSNPHKKNAGGAGLAGPPPLPPQMTTSSRLPKRVGFCDGGALRTKQLKQKPRPSFLLPAVVPSVFFPSLLCLLDGPPLCCRLN